jgi:hypothetical protein
MQKVKVFLHHVGRLAGYARSHRLCVSSVSHA